MSAAAREVIVIGAGLAGLAAGLALADAGRDVEVVEAGAEAGGLARTDAEAGYRFARGPQSFLGSAPALAWLCARSACEAALIPARAARRRFVHRKGRLHELPSSPLAFATSRLMSLRGKLRLLVEPFVRGRGAAPSAEESVSGFFTRRLGAEATDALVLPFVSGVHAGNPDALEARSAFPRLWSWEQQAGSLTAGALRERHAPKPARRGIWAPEGGLQVLSDAAAAALGTGLRLESPVDAIERDGDGWRLHEAQGSRRARHVVLAVPPPAAARLLQRSSQEAAAACDGVPMAAVAVVHHGGPLSQDARPEGFGVLVHRDAGLQALGIVFSSSLFPSLAPQGCWLQASYVGGRLHPRSLDQSDDDLCATAREATQRVLGFDPDTGIRRVVRHPRGIPQLETGHARRIETLRAECGRLGRLTPAGSWLDGIGLEAAVASGRRAAAEVLGAA